MIEAATLGEDQWASIPGFEKYEASANGDIRRKHDKRPIKSRISAKGYQCTRLYGSNGGKTSNISRFVLLAFRGMPKSNEHAAHLNGNKLDNRLTNLAWVSPIENASHKTVHGTTAIGSRHGAAKLNEDDVRQILRCVKQDRTKISIARQFNIDVRQIRLIELRKIWKHVELRDEQ